MGLWPLPRPTTGLYWLLWGPKAFLVSWNPLLLLMCVHDIFIWIPCSAGIISVYHHVIMVSSISRRKISELPGHRKPKNPKLGICTFLHGRWRHWAWSVGIGSALHMRAMKSRKWILIKKSQVAFVAVLLLCTLYIIMYNYVLSWFIMHMYLTIPLPIDVEHLPETSLRKSDDLHLASKQITPQLQIGHSMGRWVEVKVRVSKDPLTQPWFI